MDFFEAQTRARIKSRQLLVLLVGAIVCVIALSYTAVALLRMFWSALAYPEAQLGFWQPGLLIILTVATSAIVGGASWWKWRQLRADGMLVIKTLGGQWISPGTSDIVERRLINVVEEMAIASGVPVPLVYLLDDDNAINAFAAGLTPQHAAIAITRGALNQLTRDELQGVIAHEFSHILNNDIRINLTLMAMVHGLLFIALVGEGIFKDWGLLEESPFYFLKPYGAMVRVPIGVLIMAFGYTGHVFGRLIVAMISRQREFLSDAAAVQFTRNPAGIISALRKVGLSGGAVAMNKAREYRHFFFVEVCKRRAGGWFDTHPLWLDRVRAIDSKAARHIVSDALEQGELVLYKSEEEKAAVFIAKQKLLQQQTQDAVWTRQISAQKIAGAQQLIASIDPLLKNAAHDPDRVQALVLGLLLDHEPDARRIQWDLLTYESGAALKTIEMLEPALLRLPVEHRLPLVQMAVPALRMLPGLEAARFWRTADKLALSDGQVSVFEYSLLRMVQRYLVDVAAVPMRKNTAYAAGSAAAVGADAAMLLHTIAECGSNSDSETQQAFERGKAQLGHYAAYTKLQKATAVAFASKGEGRAKFKRLDVALNRLAIAPTDTKKIVLAAAAAVASDDERISVERMELFRAIADSLGYPIPLSL